MKIGIELECIYNRGLLDLPHGDYHNGIDINDYWESQRDSSINTSHKFAREEICELVTHKTLGSKKEMVKAIMSLKETFEDLSKREEELKKLLYFNNSCGAHIHFSLPNYNFWQYASGKIFKKARTKFFSLLDKSKKIDDAVKLKIKKQYSRSHSRTIGNARQRKERNVEWNFKSEASGRGMEWRSFNVIGIDTWENLVEMFEIAWKTLEWMSKECKKWSEKNNTTVVHQVKTPKPIVDSTYIQEFKNVKETNHKMKFKKLVQVTEIRVIPEPVVPESKGVIGKIKKVFGRGVVDSDENGSVEVAVAPNHEETFGEMVQREIREIEERDARITEEDIINARRAVSQNEAAEGEFLTPVALSLLGRRFMGARITRENISTVMNRIEQVYGSVSRNFTDEDEEDEEVD